MHTFLKKFLFLWILFFSTSLFADSILQKNITISDASSVHEYDSSLQFTITLSSSPILFTSVTVHYKTVNNGSATAGSDYTYTEGDVTFSSGDPTTKVISVPVLNDTIHESTEHVSVEITEDSMFYEVTDGIGEGTIYDDDLAPLELTTFNDKGVTETDTDQTLYLVAYFNQNLPSDVTVTYHTVDNTAHAGSDYVGVSGGTVTASAGNNRVLLPITIKGDTSPESTEDFKVIIDSISSGTIEDSQATATIDDDDTIEVYVDCDDADEGNVGESNNVACHIYLAKPYPAGEPDLVIDYNSQDGSSPSAIAGEDYSSVSGHVTFTTGDTEKIVNIPTIGDDVVEDDENVKMVILGSSSIVKSISEAEILNDDGNFPSVDFSTADVSVVEGNSSTKTLNFHCKLDSDAIADSYFDYYTQDDTAQSGDNDYEAISTTRYNIPVGTRDINIQVTVNGDTKVEKDELFYLKVKNENHIVVSGHRAKGTIINDDGTLATLQFDKSVYDIVEGNSSTKTLNFTLSLDNPALAGSSFDYYTFDGSAKVADSDYIGIEDEERYIFSGGETNITIPVTINGDTNIEDDEEFYLYIYNEINLTISGPQTITGNIVNDDGSYPEIQIASNSYSVVEGNSSQKNLEITLTLDAPALADSSIGYYTNDGEAQDGSSSTEDKDYISNIGTLTILEGETNASIMIPIVGDTLIEPNENFTFYIDNPHNLTIGRDNTVITILNDDEHNEEQFTCDEHMYLSSSKKRGSEETGKMWLHQIDTSTSPFRFEVMDDEGEANLYNAIGYNPEDNYIYGLYYRNLIKISKTGKIIDLGKVNALPATFDDYQLFAGAVYDSEHYYVAGMGIDTNTMYIINLNDKNVTEKTLSESINIKDFSLSPDGSLLYGIIDGGQFVKIDTTTGIVTKVGEAHSGEFDSTFSDKNGRFFANDSQGSGFYEFNTHTGAKSFLSDSQAATFNDGTNCLNAELLFTDYGDALLKYQNTWHNIANGIYLGDKIDHDIGSYDTVNADGDDLNGEDDDDGVTLIDGTDINGKYFKTGSTHQLKVKLSKEAYLKIWIDTKINGTFDNGDDLVYNSGSKLSAGEHIITITLLAGLPENTKTYLRARVSSQPSMNPTGFVLDGEVEDYMIYFGTEFTPLHGKFNIERTNSGSYAINSYERNEWYTQIVGRDFDYSLVFYKEDFSAEQNISKIAVKIELINKKGNNPLYERYVYIDAANQRSRFDFISTGVDKNSPSDDLSEQSTSSFPPIPASEDVRFRVTYPKDASGNIIQHECLTDAKTCFNNLTETKYDDARDNFAIRPEHFSISIFDKTKELVSSQNTPAKVSLAAGYKDYNLTATATKYLSSLPATDYNKTFVKKYDLNTTGTCAFTEPLKHTIKFKDGNHTARFTHNDVGRFILDLKDSNWTNVDQNSSHLGCIPNSTIIPADTTLKVGCDINLYLNDIEVNFQPDHFAVNLNMLNLPQNAGHNDFIYMMELNATNDNVAIAFDGNITAQNTDNNATSNFTAGCVATNLLLNLNATTVSVEGTNQDIFTTDNITPVNFSRIIRFNDEPNPANFDLNNTIRRINTILPISSNRFLNDRNGTMTLDMRYNLNKTLQQPINPVEVRFHNIDVNSSDANSSAYQIDNHIPSGTSIFPNNVRNFYFARVVSDLNNYPRVNINLSPLVRTPLNVDIYCGTTLANYCTDRNVIANSNIAGTIREQNGWYISAKHNGDLDGNVTRLTATPSIVTISPNPLNNISLNNGANGTVNEVFNSCPNATPSSTITITTDPVLAFEPSQYTVNCTNSDPSQWTGIGKTGNVLKVQPKVDKSGKMDW